MHMGYLALIIDTVYINPVIIIYYIHGLISDENIHSELWDIPTSANRTKYEESPSPPPLLGEGKWSYNLGKNKNEEMYVYKVKMNIIQ